MKNNGAVFVADVHLGLAAFDALEREQRFVSFLKSERVRNAEALYLLGDIWDFWYEYKYVVPKEGIRVIAALMELIDDGVEVFFMPGNHDIWCYHWFEQLGMHKIEQPYYTEICGKTFCLGHGDNLGGGGFGLKLMEAAFHSKVLQALFSSLHPRIAFAIGNGWSRRNREAHKSYVFREKDEPIFKFAASVARQHHVDYFIFGHYHIECRMDIPGGAQMYILGDWMRNECPYLYFSGMGLEGGNSIKME